MTAVRIAFFIDDYLPSVHGVATSTATFRAALERMGHEVYVVAPKAEGYEETDDHVIRLPSSRYYVFDSREVVYITAKHLVAKAFFIFRRSDIYRGKLM